MPPEIGYPIKYVAKHTGLSTHVIRVWERRYNAVSPIRTPTNRRVYSDSDIKRLQLLHQATKAGYNISQIAGLDTDELAELALKDAQYAIPAVTVPEPPDAGTETPQDYVDRCIVAIKELDSAHLEHELGRAGVALSQVKLLAEVIEPLMHHIGDAWEQGDLRIADEHLASAVVRTFISKMQNAYSKEPSGPSILVSTPAGQRHEIGALLVANAAAAAGWQIIYVGPDLPANEIAGAAQRARVQAIALSIVYPADDPQLGDELRHLRQILGPHIPILVGGRSAAGYTTILQGINAVMLHDIGALKTHLESLRSRPNAQD